MFKEQQHTIFSLADTVGRKLLETGNQLSTAESCTGGGIGYALTHIPGSSRWYLGGINAYSNQVKQTQLRVDERLIATEGAVSEMVAEQMAVGVARLIGAEVALSTSGIAGPDGGTPDKPVGTICFGWSIAGSSFAETRLFSGDREHIRLQSIEHSLKILLERL